MALHKFTNWTHNAILKNLSNNCTIQTKPDILQNCIPYVALKKTDILRKDTSLLKGNSDVRKRSSQRIIFVILRVKINFFRSQKSGHIKIPSFKDDFHVLRQRGEGNNRHKVPKNNVSLSDLTKTLLKHFRGAWTDMEPIFEKYDETNFGLWNDL